MALCTSLLAPSFQTGGKIDLLASWKLGVAIPLAVANEIKLQGPVPASLYFPPPSDKVLGGGCSIRLGS